MEKGETILEIYNRNIAKLSYNERFPFAVKKINWSADYYVIVEEIEINSGEAQGIPTKGGNIVRLFFDDLEWRRNLIIPHFNQPIWIIVKGINFSHYKRNGGLGNTYEIDSRLKWGKHKGLSIDELCQEHLDYIEWCVQDLEHNFCLSNNAITSLKDKGISFSKGIVDLNQEKLKWYQNGLAEELTPSYYKRQVI
jgi:hypothetical protein